VLKIKSEQSLSFLRSLLVVMSFALVGCAATMPLSPDQPVALKPQESLAVFTLTLRNDFKNYLLTPQRIFVEASAINGGKTYRFAFGQPEQKVSDRELKMVGSFALPPGDYEITYFTGHTDIGFALLPVAGKFEPPFKKFFRLGGDEAVYLGHVMARLVEKTSDNEERAGPVLPLLDQAATGMSSGTFKFDIVDRYSEDVSYIKTRFPSVASREFTKRLMTDAPDASRPALAQAQPVQVSAPVVNPTESRSRPSKVEEKDSGECSVTQILEMKKLGLSDAQIKKSCS
jgi:hypothetical protein